MFFVFLAFHHVENMIERSINKNKKHRVANIEVLLGFTHAHILLFLARVHLAKIWIIHPLQLFPSILIFCE